METSDIIRQAYIKSGLTYSEISVLTDIKANTLANWITGRRNPPTYVAKTVFEKIKKHISPSEQKNIEIMFEQIGKGKLK